MPDQLTETIILRIDIDGNLLYADPAFRRLHIRAGGSDGGKVAIPSIANIAMLTHKLNMPLSRMINVADQDFDIELWIDSHIEDGVAVLSILGWTEKHIVEANEPEGVSIDNNAYQDDIFFLCNESNIITYFQSDEKYVALFGDFIGSNFFDIVSADKAIINSIREIFAQHKTVDHNIVSIKALEGVYELSAIPRRDDQENFLGYECYISPYKHEFVSNELNENSESNTIYQGLISAQLAPAIRQPLGRIIANADTIGSKLHGPIRENYANYAHDIANAARHLIEIVDDLSDLEALDKPGFAIAKDDIELGDIATRLAGLMALKASDKNIKVTIDAMDDLVNAVGEFRRVLQIGLNLLANAVRYSPENTEITISYGATDDTAYLSIRDQGPGISTDMHHKVFEKFERLGRTGDGGSGLGLYISHRLARAMGGDLVLESEAGKGACFILYLPK